MDWILILGIPLVLGALWGAWQGRRDRFSFVVLLTAPIFSAVLGGIIIAMLAAAEFILSGRPPLLVDPNNPEPLVLQWLVAIMGITGMYGCGICSLGAVPTLLGSTGGQLGKLWVVHRDSGIRRIGRGESEKEDIQDIQAEPGNPTC